MGDDGAFLVSFSFGDFHGLFKNCSFSNFEYDLRSVNSVATLYFDAIKDPLHLLLDSVYFMHNIIIIIGGLFLSNSKVLCNQ